MNEKKASSNLSSKMVPARQIHRWLLKTVVLVVLVEVAYLLAANALLRGDALPRFLNRDPDRFNIAWSSGGTLIPGRFSFENLEVAGSTGQHRWAVATASADVQVSLWRLPFGTLHLGRFLADEVALSLQPFPVEPNDTGRHLQSPETEVDPLSAAPADRAAPITASDPPPADLPWTIEIGALELAKVQGLEVDGYRLAGVASVEGEHIRLRGADEITVERARLRLSPSMLTAGTEAIARDLQLDADLHLSPFRVRGMRLKDAAMALSGTVQLSGRAASYRFFERLLTAGRGLRLDGHGDLRAALRFEAGRLVAGSELALDSPRLAVELDAPADLQQGGPFAVEGAGEMRTSVVAADDGPQTRVQIELRDMAARRGADADAFLTGRAFRLTATGPPLDLGKPPVEPTVVVELEDTSMPDVSALNDYIPGTPPFHLLSGSARLDGRLENAKGVLSGSLHLAGERIAGQIFERAVVGELGIELVIRQADYRTKRLDLSGTRIRMQAAREDAREDAPLSTDINLLEARLSASADPGASRFEAAMPPFDGVLRLEGRVANLEFLSAFLPQDAGLEIGGDGHVTAGLQVQGGRLAAGSQVEVASERLVSRFLDFEAKGSGLVQAAIQSADADQEAVVQVGLRDMEVLRISDGKPVLKGDALALTASGRLPGPGTTPAEPKLIMAWQNATVPDVAVLNAYLAGSKVFGLKSGVARASGRLEYARDILSGKLDLAGERIAGTVFGESVTGQLELGLVVAGADLKARQLDLSGTHLRMQAASGRKGKKKGAPLHTELRFPQARLESELPLAELRDHPGPPPISGVLKADGTVANIDFINRFLGGKQRLGFHGDGRLSADLRLGRGRLASGSALEIRSGNLASRFLDFEAKGAGLLKARVTGKASAPGAGIEVTISDFQFRRLDETTPYIQGKRLDLKTAGKRLDKDNVLRELDTDIELWEAQIPDMTVYNRYLPPDSGVAIVSGKGVVEGGFALKGVSGSGDLQLRAKGVEVRFQDQRLKGDLLIYTRLRDGDLDAMTFDASGTRVRLDKGSLLTGKGTAGQEWWGQIDLEEGRMTWKQPLELDARVGLQLRDSGLLVNLFVRKANIRNGSASC